MITRSRLRAVAVTSVVVAAGGLLTAAPASAAVWTDLSTDFGTTYHYVVAAVDQAGHESPVSAEVALTTPGDLVAPGPVPGLTATPREDGVLLQWDPSPEPDLKRYDVYKGEWQDDGEGDGFWSYHQIAWLGESETSYLHETPADGETVRYAVVAVDDWGNSRVGTGEEVSVVTVTELGGAAAS